MNNVMAKALEIATSSWNAQVAAKKTTASGKLIGVHVAVGIVQVTNVGEVRCRLSLAEGVTTQMAEHTRKTWEFNGKKITAAKLAAM